MRNYIIDIEFMNDIFIITYNDESKIYLDLNDKNNNKAIIKRLTKEKEYLLTLKKEFKILKNYLFFLMTLTILLEIVLFLTLNNVSLKLISLIFLIFLVQIFIAYKHAFVNYKNIDNLLKIIEENKISFDPKIIDIQEYKDFKNNNISYYYDFDYPEKYSSDDLYNDCPDYIPSFDKGKILEFKK